MFKKVTVMEIPSDVRGQVLTALRNSEELLATYKFVSPSSTEKSRMGFSHTGISPTFVSIVDDNIIMKVTTQSKSVNKNEVKAIHKVMQIKYKDENNTDQVPKKVDQILKEDAELKVLASTFPSEEKHHYVVFRKDGKVLVEGKGKVAEDSISLIRKVLGSLPVLPLDLQGDIHSMLKDWIKKDLNDKLMLGEKATVISAPTEGVEGVEHRIKGRIGTNTKVLAILKEELAVATEVEVEYDSVIKTSISDEFVFSSIKFSKELTSETEDKSGSLVVQMHETNRLVDHVLGMLAIY